MDISSKEVMMDDAQSNDDVVSRAATIMGYKNKKYQEIFAKYVPMSLKEIKQKFNNDKLAITV